MVQRSNKWTWYQHIHSACGVVDCGWSLHLVHTTSSTSLQVLFGTTCYTSGDVLLCDGRWHQVGATIKKSAVSLYVDGVHYSTHSITTEPPKVESDIVRIGSFNGDDVTAFEGRMRDVCVYNTVLTAAEMRLVATKLSPTDTPPLRKKQSEDLSLQDDEQLCRLLTSSSLAKRGKTLGLPKWKPPAPPPKPSPKPRIKRITPRCGVHM
eukprot:TRINITY_DN59355_c0_g1_i2.p1 TRINITY_DN59355_c0_g1~~TRINITY_DN59355_c0_g1_i2.p1  ORF type:complete len:208 (+),score=20.60 TRINITY_DN59355_c0_g1_i2:592-1215(+)